MKCCYKLMISLLFFTQVHIARSQKPYSIKSAKIAYAFSNGLQTGTKVLVFNDFGAIEKVDVITITDTVKAHLLFDSTDSLSVRMPRLFIKDHISVIQTLDSVFHINYNLRIFYSRARFNMFGLFEKYLKKRGEEFFLGKRCEVYDMNGFKMWYWKGLCLKKEFDKLNGEGFYEYATLIDENYVPGDNEFDITKEIKQVAF